MPEMTAHLVGSVPLADAEAVFRTVAGALGPHLRRLPDGETGIRRTWIKFLQDVLANHPGIEVAADLPPLVFRQWDGTIVREIPRLRVATGAKLDPAALRTGYADMAIASFEIFDRLQREGAVPAGVRFQISLPSPLAPAYNNMVPEDRPAAIAMLTRHFAGEVQKIAATLPNERVAIQWDVCQEVLAWEGYYAPGPVPFERETIDVLTQIGDAVPPTLDLGYHLCYGSPADEHLVQPTDTRVMVDIANRVAAGVTRPIDFFHLPVPKPRTDDAFFAPLRDLRLADRTALYLGLVHHNDDGGNEARLAAARRFTRVDGVATECGWGRGDPSKVNGLLAALAHTARLP
jgi:hypothetical protein